MVSREELHRLVWSEPMTKIGERFGVSGSYLARVCTLLNVPRPERGYWAKLAVGKAPPQVPLSAPRPGGPFHWRKEGERIANPKPKAPPRRGATKKPRIARNEIHSLIRGAKSHFLSGRPVEEGAYLKPYKKLLVDVTASQASLDKALDLANDLFNAFESVDYRVVLAPADANLRRVQIDEREAAAKPRDYWQHGGLWSPYRPTVVYVGTVAIGLLVVEVSENVTLRYLNGKYVRESDYTPPRNRYRADYSWTTTRELPSGRMRILAYSPYGRVNWSTQWQETRSTSLRNQIRAIVKAIEAEAPKLVEKLEEADRQAEIQHQKWLAEQELRRREEDRRSIENRSRKAKLSSGRSFNAGPMSWVSSVSWRVSSNVLTSFRKAKSVMCSSGWRSPAPFWAARILWISSAIGKRRKSVTHRDILRKDRSVLVELIVGVKR